MVQIFLHIKLAKGELKQSFEKNQQQRNIVNLIKVISPKTYYFKSDNKFIKLVSPKSVSKSLYSVMKKISMKSIL